LWIGSTAGAGSARVAVRALARGIVAFFQIPDFHKQNRAVLHDFAPQNRAAPAA
jgi:hypothetical protein